MSGVLVAERTTKGSTTAMDGRERRVVAADRGAAIERTSETAGTPGQIGTFDAKQVVVYSGSTTTTCSP
jgi:hypothetical protein